MIIAVDFDGTLQKDGKANTALFQRLIQAQRNGDIIILWSCRTGNSLMDAIRFSAEHGLRFNHVNENCPAVIQRFKTNPRKVYADLYIDDKAMIWT